MRAKTCLVLLITALPMLVLADGRGRGRGDDSWWIHDFFHAIVCIFRPEVVIVSPAPAPVVYVQPAPPPVVYVQPQPVIQPPPVVYVQPQPAPPPVVIVTPAPVYIPESYIWDGYEFVGWVGNQYVYYNGTGWYVCRPEHMVHFHEYGRMHPDYRSHAQRYERNREPQHQSDHGSHR